MATMRTFFPRRFHLSTAVLLMFLAGAVMYWNLQRETALVAKHNELVRAMEDLEHQIRELNPPKDILIPIPNSTTDKGISYLTERHDFEEQSLIIELLLKKIKCLSDLIHLKQKWLLFLSWPNLDPKK